MIHRRYNHWFIDNHGERAVDKLLDDEAYPEEDLVVEHGLRISGDYHKNQMAGECDFLIVCCLGVLVVEVKGGIIGYGEISEGNQGYYRQINPDTREPLRNPFIQSDGYKDAIIEFLKKKGIDHVFVGSLVCFPECQFDAKGIGTGSLWHTGCEAKFTESIYVELEDQIEHFNKIYSSREWKQLELAEMTALCESLSPRFDPEIRQSHLVRNRNEARDRLRQGLEILKGLDENRRIAVQGPPGSGKSTYALDLIRRIINDEDARGLYLCWNELLASHLNQVVAEHLTPGGENHLEAIPYYDFICQLAEKTGDPNLVPSIDSINQGKLPEFITTIMNRLRKARLLPRYDYIIVDEAQDVFAKGLDKILKDLLNARDPISDGRYFIFYDDRQAFPQTRDLEAYIVTRDLLRSHSACYTLFSSLRVQTGQGIGELIRDAETRQISLDRKYGEDLSIRRWKEIPDAIRNVEQILNQEKILSHGQDADSVILFTYDLLRPESGLPALLDTKKELVAIGKQVGQIPSGKTGYTSILRTKGLEWDTVILVSSSLKEARNNHQLFIGASRARLKVYLLVQEDA
jgi:hypothetical protein